MDTLYYAQSCANTGAPSNSIRADLVAAKTKQGGGPIVAVADLQINYISAQVSITRLI